jgi:glycosyltransferase involved in cell wall biosynthesis
MAMEADAVQGGEAIRSVAIVQNRAARRRLLHVVPSFWPAVRFGGPIESTAQLCRSLAAAGCEVTVLTTDSDGPGARLAIESTGEVELAPRMKVRYCRKLAGNSVAPEMIPHLFRYARAADVVHLTGVYNFPTFPALAICRRLQKPLVWSPRGSLQDFPGRRRAFLKALWDRLCCEIAPSHTIVHATAEPEAESIRKAMPGLSVAIIPNGVTIPEVPLPRPGPAQALRALFIGRLDAKKGIENLLEACAILKRGNFLEFTLTIAGGGEESYRWKLSDRINRLELGAWVQMIGEVQGGAKEQAFAAADIVIVPSYIENFAMVVAEALARERPVIASRGTPWAEIERVGCGLWVDNSPQALSDALCRISTMPLAEMGERGRRWMSEQFGWPTIAREMLACYSKAIAATDGTDHACSP